jgi:hypothetical protein
VKRSPQFDFANMLNLGNMVVTLGTMNAMLTSLRSPDPSAPKSTVAEVQAQSTEGWAGWGDVKKSKIRYGPYRIPPTSEKNLESEILNEKGMGNTFKLGATKPCRGECTLLSLSASMEYSDGSAAENANGVGKRNRGRSVKEQKADSFHKAWFHHALLLNAGPSANKGACSQPLPIENMFMVGNEKSSVYFGLADSTIRSGYRLTSADTLILDTQLMNMEDKEKWVWVTVTYEHLDGPQVGFKNGRNVWKSLSVSTAGTCAMSKVNPFGASNLTSEMNPKSLTFVEHSIPWQAPFDGYILMTGGHMHDGGVNTEIYQNDKLICTSVATYGKSGGGHGAMGSSNGGSAHNMEIEHIVGQSRCEFPDGIPLKKGDKMYIRANYDFRQHAG